MPSLPRSIDPGEAERDRLKAAQVTVTEAIARLLDAQTSLRNNRRLQTAMRFAVFRGGA